MMRWSFLAILALCPFCPLAIHAQGPPVVSYYAPPVPAVTYYPAPVPATVTTYRYGLLGRRVATTVTYGTPAPVVAAPVVVAPAPVTVRSYYYAPPVVVAPRPVVVRYPRVILYP
jgi:hypothetical protein